jgi:hypothetical protein
LSELPGQRELLFSNGALIDHRLQVAGAVSQDQEMQLALIATASQPPPHRDLLADMPGGVFNVHMRHAISRSNDVADARQRTALQSALQDDFRDFV